MIDVKPQHTFLAFWIISYPPESMTDVMGAIWRDGDSGEYLGLYRFRYYDPRTPGMMRILERTRKNGTK